MAHVGLARVSVFTPFTEFLHRGGSSVERHLCANGIDPRLLQDEGALIPLHWACEFLEQVAHREGISNFGFEVGSCTRITQLGGFGAILSRAMSLKDLVDRILRTVPLFDSGARAWTEPGTTLGTFKLCLRHEARDGRPSADAFGLCILIDAVRLVLGPEWRPERYWIDRAAGAGLEAYEALSGGEAIRDIDHLAFEIPRGTLHLPALSPTRLPAREAQFNGPREDLVGSLSQAIRSAMGTRLPTATDAASLAGVSERTLHRRLGKAGLTYRELVSRVRHREALLLLEDQSRPIAEIAHHLGYRDPANFTHAFRRWTGQSPQAYRHVIRRKGLPAGG